MTIHSKCCYCRRTFSLEDKHLKRTRDHFIPLSRGGNGGENILECCHECNQWKNDKMPEYWLKGVLFLSSKRRLVGSYNLSDYKQIIGSIRHWIKQLKGKKISEYKY